MIEIKDVKKRFDTTQALDGVSAVIRENTVFGLIGTNGAGKSTLLRAMSGILKCDGGAVTIDGQDVYADPGVRERLFYISDDQYFFENDKPSDMMRFYSGLYPAYDRAGFLRLMDMFELPLKQKIRTFSKGMKKQLFVALGLSSGAKYLFCDETFDGLDPIMREKVKALFKAAQNERGMTPVIASHSLRELEDICEDMVMLHKGGVVDLRETMSDEMRSSLGDILPGAAGPALKKALKINIILKKGTSPEVLDVFDVRSRQVNGSIFTLIVNETEEELSAKVAGLDPFFCEILPLTLEEMFINGLAVSGTLNAEKGTPEGGQMSVGNGSPSSGAAFVGSGSPSSGAAFVGSGSPSSGAAHAAEEEMSHE